MEGGKRRTTIVSLGDERAPPMPDARAGNKGEWGYTQAMTTDSHTLRERERKREGFLFFLSVSKM